MLALIPTDRKTRWLCGWVLLSGVVLGGLGGYFVARWRLQPMSMEPFAIWEHLAEEREAKAYLYALQASETGATNDLRQLQRRGWADLFVYVRGVEEIQKRYAYPWCPLDRDVFERAQDYLARHPRSGTNILTIPRVPAR